MAQDMCGLESGWPNYYCKWYWDQVSTFFDSSYDDIYIYLHCIALPLCIYISSYLFYKIMHLCHNCLLHFLRMPIRGYGSNKLVSEGTWLLSGAFGALRPEGCRFESRSSRHLGTLGKPFTRSFLEHFGVLTPTQYECCNQECLWVVVKLKRCYWNIRNEWWMNVLLE